MKKIGYLQSTPKTREPSVKKLIESEEIGCVPYEAV